MLKNIFYVLAIALIFGCQPQKNKPKKVIVEIETLTIEEDDSLFDNACGSEYVETLKAHEAFYGDNPPLIVFKKIPKKSK